MERLKKNIKRSGMEYYSKRHRNFSAKLVAEEHVMKNSSTHIDEFTCV